MGNGAALRRQCSRPSSTLQKRLRGVAPPVALEVLVYLFAEAVIVALSDRSRVMTFTIHTAVLSPRCRAMVGGLCTVGIQYH